MQNKSTRNPNAFVTKLIQTNIAALALDQSFQKWDLVSQSLLSDVVKNKIEKMCLEIKACTEINGRTDSNLIDALAGINYTTRLTKDDFKKQIVEPTFSNISSGSETVKKVQKMQ
jgi:hypothetical protein